MMKRSSPDRPPIRHPTCRPQMGFGSMQCEGPEDMKTNSAKPANGHSFAPKSVQHTEQIWQTQRNSNQYQRPMTALSP